MLLADGLIQKDFDALAQACQNMRLNFFLSCCFTILMAAFDFNFKRLSHLLEKI